MKKKLTKEKAKQIYEDIRIYYIGKRYNYGNIFTDSGNYDDMDKNTLYNFVSPLLHLIETKGSEAFEEFIQD